MKKSHAIKILRDWDKKGIFVFKKHTLRKLFPEDSPKTFDESLSRLVKDDILKPVSRGIYVNPHANSFSQYVLEKIVIALRPANYSYVSLESMLSQYGVISQIPIDRLTVMTTGRRGVYETPYGIIEMTHTKRSVENILQNTIKIEDNPLRIATKQTAYRDLKRVGRNLDLIDLSELSDD
jgi:predicted transcriptional regulator of viral defense system